MSWRDDLRTASFRGVPFYVGDIDGTYGRRTALHEYPQRNKPHNEDLGRATRTIAIEAYVVGDDHVDQANALIAAVEKAGPAELVHPFQGIMRGICTLQVRQSMVTDGNMTRLRLAFTEEGENEFPAVTVNAVSAIDAAAAALDAATAELFEQAFSLTDAASFVIDAADVMLDLVDGTMQGQLLSLVSASPLGAAITNQVSRLSYLQSRVRDEPKEYATGVSDSMTAIVEAADPAPAYTAIVNIASGFGSDLKDVEQTTQQREMQASNQAAVIDMFRTQAIAGSARAIVRREFEVYDDAIGARDALLAAIDAEQLVTTSDDVYAAMSNLRLQVSTSVPAEGEELARITTYTPRATEPALVSAYRLYEDATRGDEIAARNGVANPGFLPGGVALEVLTDV